MIAVPCLRPDGTVMDLAAPLPSDIVWPEIAAGLSKLARWNGRPRGPAFSVAQHCVMGADALFAETGDAICAAYFLLHDAHEALLGDVPSTTVALIEHIAGRRSGINLALKTAKARIDEAIYAAARIIPLGHAHERNLVQAMDERMLRAEALALYGRNADLGGLASRTDVFIRAATLPAPKLVGAIRPWGPAKAEEAWLARLDRFLGIRERPA